MHGPRTGPDLRIARVVHGDARAVVHASDGIDARPLRGCARPSMRGHASALCTPPVHIEPHPCTRPCACRIHARRVHAAPARSQMNTHAWFGTRRLAQRCLTRRPPHGRLRDVAPGADEQAIATRRAHPTQTRSSARRAATRTASWLGPAPEGCNPARARVTPRFATPATTRATTAFVTLGTRLTCLIVASRGGSHGRLTGVSTRTRGHAYA